ncbi:hypothetical protein [Streptomyces sp. Da 82-17]|uniref:Rv1733c family protein n=1 Tax=Streptomyces sp. Da 82-17 TaxID=3377116 RepID=UPI0038D42879
MSDHEQVPGRPSAGPHGRVLPPFLLTVAVLCGVVAMGFFWDAGARADRERAEHLHRVKATTVEKSVVTAGAAWRGASAGSAAAAVWEYPDDVRRTGTIEVQGHTPQGSTVTIWVDDSGAVARPPGTAGELVLTSLAGGIVVAGAVAGSGVGLQYLARRRAEGRRLAEWEEEWARVEPIWSGRQRRGSGSGNGDG